MAHAPGRKKYEHFGEVQSHLGHRTTIHLLAYFWESTSMLLASYLYSIQFLAELNTHKETFHFLKSADNLRSRPQSEPMRSAS